MAARPGHVVAPLVRSLGALHDYSAKVAAKHSSLGTALFEEPNRVLAKLKQCIADDVHKITAEIVRLQGALRLARQETLLAMAAFERAYWSTEASRDHATGDPWLTQVVLQTKTARLAAEEQAFNTAMLSFHAELAKIDAFLMENAQATNRSIGSLAATVEPKGAFLDFAHAHQLEDVDVWRGPVQSVPYRYQNGPLARVYKDGMALRQVGTVSNSWRDCFLVLTEGGFLHGYDTESPLDVAALGDRLPSFSMSVRQAAVETPQQGRAAPTYVLEVAPPTAATGYMAAMGVHRAVLQVHTLHDLQAWTTALKFKATEAPEPALVLDEQGAELVDSDGELHEDFVLLSVAADTPSRGPAQVGAPGNPVAPLARAPSLATGDDLVEGDLVRHHDEDEDADADADADADDAVEGWEHDLALGTLLDGSTGSVWDGGNGAEASRHATEFSMVQLPAVPPWHASTSTTSGTAWNATALEAVPAGAAGLAWSTASGDGQPVTGAPTTDHDGHGSGP